MSQRVNQEEVRKLLSIDGNNPLIDVQPYIDIATAVTDKVSSNDTLSVLTTALLKQIEMLLSAYYYSLADPGYMEEKTEDASAKYDGETGKGFEYNRWGQAALAVDITGFLASLGQKQAIGLTWLGTPPSGQTDYVDRD